MPLQVDECFGSNYDDVFWQLQDVPLGDAIPKLSGCIFYTSLWFTNRPNYDNPEALCLNLSRGRFLPSGRREQYTVAIEWAEWSEQQRRSFAHRFEAQRQDIARTYRAAKQKGARLPSATLYVLGTQDEENALVFRVNDPRKIALILQSNGLYPDRKPVRTGDSAPPSVRNVDNSRAEVYPWERHQAYAPDCDPAEQETDVKVSITDVDAGPTPKEIQRTSAEPMSDEKHLPTPPKVQLPAYERQPPSEEARAIIRSRPSDRLPSVPAAKTVLSPRVESLQATMRRTRHKSRLKR
jgi:hypothetical protein